MIDDFKLLGIEKTNDLAKIKKAFRVKMKALHPDTSKEGRSFKNHLLFVAVCQAYDRLIGEKNSGAAGSVHRPSPAATADGGLMKHSDPAYVFYKAGMKYFMKIHPSQWNLETHRRLNTKVPGHDAAQEKMRQKVKSLSSLFPKAYYYFKIVFYEYPDSPWARDAAAKMALIEERTIRYKRIIESFEEPPGGPHRRIK